MSVQSIKAKIEIAAKKGGLTPDERIDLEEQITAEEDMIYALRDALSEIDDLLPEDEGKPSAVIPANSAMVRAKYRTV